MKVTNLIIKIKGPNVSEGIDVFDLAPSLLAMGEVIREANEVIGLPKRELGINIRPFEKGSFIIDIGLFAETNLQQIMQFLDSDTITYIKQILELVGFIKLSGGMAFGLIKLLRWLKGRPRKTERLESGEVKYTNSEGNSVIVNEKVDKLYNSPIIIKNLYLGYKTIEKEGIEEIESSLKDDPTTKVQSNKEDVEALRISSEIAENIEEIDIPDREVNLTFKRGSFGGDPTNWSFWFNKDILTATIKDKEFIRKLEDGRIRPNHLDTFIVILRERKKMREQQYLSSTYEIIKIVKYEKGPLQKQFKNLTT